MSEKKADLVNSSEVKVMTEKRMDFIDIEWISLILNGFH
jgi:hypothetical protein